MHLEPLVWASLALGATLLLVTTHCDAGWLDALDRQICGKRLVRRGSGFGGGGGGGQKKLKQHDNGTEELDSSESDDGGNDDQDQDQDDTLANYMSAGYEAYKGQYPWFTMIEVRYRWQGIMSCGGVIIHNNVVLTAAHCVTSPRRRAPDSVRVLAGITSLDDRSNSQSRSGVRVSRSNKFNINAVENPFSMRSRDIAVILLDRPLEYDDYVQPICLPSAGSNLQRRSDCMAAGLGLVDSRGNRAPRNIMTMPMRVCRLTRARRLDETCFESADARRYPGRPCQGDSGSAMVCPDSAQRGDSAQFYAVGVVSNGPGEVCRRGLVENVNYANVVYQRAELLSLVRSVTRSTS